MRRILGLAAAALMALPLTACSFGNHMAFKAQTDLSRTTEHAPESALLVDTLNGRIEVVAEPQRSDVLIEARLRCRGYTQADADERLAATTLDVSRDANRRLVVKPVFPGGRRSGDGASVSIRIPDATGVHLDTSNGSVVAASLAGRLVVDTSNGSIKVTDHDGPARLDTSNGSVNVSNLAGTLWADTSNGAITLTNVAGSVEVDTSNGSITLANVAGPVQADTSNGAIRLSLSPDQAGPLRLDTSNGSITVEVGPAFVGSVTFDTSNGSIHVDDQVGRIRSSSIRRGEGRVTVGEGGQPSRLDTSNASIRFTIAG
jgi:hypothetical protein